MVGTIAKAVAKAVATGITNLQKVGISNVSGSRMGAFQIPTVAKYFKTCSRRSRGAIRSLKQAKTQVKTTKF